MRTSIDLHDSALDDSNAWWFNNVLTANVKSPPQSASVLLIMLWSSPLNMHCSSLSFSSSVCTIYESESELRHFLYLWWCALVLGWVDLFGFKIHTYCLLLSTDHRMCLMLGSIGEFSNFGKSENSDRVGPLSTSVAFFVPPLTMFYMVKLCLVDMQNICAWNEVWLHC